MRIHPLGLVIVGCVGGVLGWIGHSALQQLPSETSASRAFDVPTRSESTADRAIAADAPHPGSTPASTNDGESGTQPAGSSRHSSAGASAPNNSSSASFVAIPNAADDATPTSATGSADSTLPADLQKSAKLWCKYDPGNGAHLRDGIVTKYDLAYQGGPVTFEAIDIGAGTARMTGSPGATGSLEGVLDVLASTTRAGLHFSAVNSRGELMVATVFGAVDRNGRHPSVMTTHGMHAFNGSYQIYGSCDAS